MILDAGPFRVGVRAGDKGLIDTLGYFYRDCVLYDGPHVLDYEIHVTRPLGMRRYVRPQVRFSIDGIAPFEPQPLENAFPMFEWGLNWCIATSAHQLMMLHAGVVAFADRALVMPGTPGSGKSTLTAALNLRGARLLSDEFGLVRPDSGELMPMPRAVPLKNASIDAIIEFAPAASLGPTYPKTRKGRVRHLRSDAGSRAEQARPARPRWLVFPRYDAECDELLSPLSKGDAFRRLAFNCFNYKLLGETAFRTIARIVRDCDCYSYRFSRLEYAVEQLEALATQTRDSEEKRQ